MCTVAKEGNIKDVFVNPSEYTSASEAEQALQIGSQNPFGATPTPKWGLELSTEGANFKYAGEVYGGSDTELITNDVLKVLRIFPLQP